MEAVDSGIRVTFIDELVKVNQKDQALGNLGHAKKCFGLLTVPKKVR